MFVMTVYWQDLTGNVTDVTWQTVCFRISDSHLCELKFNNFESVLCEMRSGTPVIIFHAHANQRLTDMAFPNDLPHLAHQIANANTNLILWVDKKANREKKTEAERERERREGENSSLERQFKQIFWSVNGIVWFKRGSSLHNLKRAFDAIESQSGGKHNFFFFFSLSLVPSLQRQSLNATFIDFPFLFCMMIISPLFSLLLPLCIHRFCFPLRCVCVFVRGISSSETEWAPIMEIQKLIFKGIE